MGKLTGRRLRRAIQILALILFLLLFFGTRSDSALPLPADTFFRLDPLAALTAMLASRRVIPAMLLSLIVVALTVALGRVWCGWLCPLGTVLDLAGPRWGGRASSRRPQKAVARAVPTSFRNVKYMLLLVIVFAALLANQTLMILDPLALLTRTLTTVVLPAIDVAFTAVERVLYAVGFLQAPIGWLDAAVRGPLLPMAPVTYSLSFLIALIFAGVLLLNHLAPRFWCRYLCPLGALLGLLSRVALLRRAVSSACISCNRCASACPTGTVDAEAAYTSDPAECILCLECRNVCPASAITFPMGSPALAPSQPAYDPSRKQWLGSLGLAAALASVARVVPAASRISPFLIRPPGGRENHLADKCIRCGECLKICPTGGLQPAYHEEGWSALWTPVLTPRIGYCDYSCNACGRVCPSGAIPRLELDVKRTVVIGKAYINTNRCLPWADNRSCIVCEEMCPVPDKAIKLDDVEITDAAGNRALIRRPRVERERCIGCGICEYQCPVAGEAAIRVYYPTDLAPDGAG